MKLGQTSRHPTETEGGVTPNAIPDGGERSGAVGMQFGNLIGPWAGDSAGATGLTRSRSPRFACCFPDVPGQHDRLRGARQPSD